MKTIAAFAFVAGVAAMPELMIANRPQVGDYTTVVQKVFKGAGQCTESSQDTSIPLGKCTPDGHGAFIMACSDDGTSFNQTQYSDEGCTQQSGVVPGDCGACLPAGALLHVEFVCQ